MDRLKLIKFLNLSTSNSDGEALNSIRKANIYLNENNLTWEEIFTEKKPISINIKDPYENLYWDFKKLKQLHQQEVNEFKENIKFSRKVVIGLFIFVVVLVILLILK